MHFLFGLIFTYELNEAVTATPQTINRKDIVNQNVFFAVGSSLFIFFNISTRLTQNIIAKMGIK
jgi:hypothetical protein